VFFMAEVETQTVPVTAVPATPTSSAVNAAAVPAEKSGSNMWLWVGAAIAVIVIAGLVYWFI
jgi:hypothetical protein